MAFSLAFAPFSRASEGLWNLALRTQGVVDFEPGQDLFEGPEIGYSDSRLFGYRLQFKAAYLTSRLEQAFRSRILRQDYFLFSPVWHFRSRAFFDPTFQMDLGYWRYDVESDLFEDLDNDSWVAAVQVGFALNLARFHAGKRAPETGGRHGGAGGYGLFYHFGYNLITPDSGLLYPGVFGIGLWKTL